MIDNPVAQHKPDEEQSPSSFETIRHKSDRRRVKEEKKLEGCVCNSEEEIEAVAAVDSFQSRPRESICVNQ